MESIRVLNGVPDCAGRQSYNLSAPSRPKGINLGPDGHVWFTEAWSDKVARINNDGPVLECPLPDPDIFPSSPMEIVCATIPPE